MTPEQLKSSILQYAIQGKLVEQRSEEGTGEELYQQIQEEKQRLVKEGKIKTEKPLSEIVEDEIPFDIPESWKWVRIPEIGTSSLGKTLNKSIDAGKEVNYLCSINVYWEGISLDQVKTAKFSAVDMEKYLLQRGDLLVCEGGDVGRSAVWDSDTKMYYQNALHCVRFFGGTNPYFFRYCFELYKRNKILENASKGMTIKHLVQGSLHSILFPLPPLAEQKRIVAKIEELLPLVDRYAASYEKLEQFNAKFPEDMKKSILQYAIQGKLVEQRPEEGTGEELYQQIQVYKQELIKDGKLKKTRALEPISEVAIPFDFPPSWKVCYIDDIAFVTKLAGFEYTKYIADNLVTDGIPLFKGKNVQNGKLVLSFESYIPESISDELPRSQIAKKCLLTPYVGTIGNIAIFDGSFKAHLGSNVGKIELLNSDTQTFVLEEYVLWYLKSTYGYAELTKHKKATAQESISIDAIRNVIIAIPPLEEQYRIVAKIEELLPLCERLRK